VLIIAYIAFVIYSVKTDRLSPVIHLGLFFVIIFLLAGIFVSIQRAVESRIPYISFERKPTYVYYKLKCPYFVSMDIYVPKRLSDKFEKDYNVSKTGEVKLKCIIK